MRLDIYMCKNLGVESRSKAANMIELGNVSLNGKIALKPSINVDNKIVEILSKMEFASMGGYKLKKALTDFNFSVKDQVVADIGASNGGFTHCLLNNGASKVFAVDVGDCALPDFIKNDGRVVVLDKMNAKDIVLDNLKQQVDLAVIDVSFISLTQVLIPIGNLVKEGGKIIALIKPQFEVGKKSLGKSGIVSLLSERRKACEKVITYANACGLKFLKITTAPIREKKNIEYLALLNKNSIKS